MRYKHKGSAIIELTFVMTVIFILIVGFIVGFGYFHSKYVLNNLTYNIASLWANSSKLHQAKVSDVPNLEQLSRILLDHNSNISSKTDLVFTRCIYNPQKKVSIKCIELTPVTGCHMKWDVRNTFPQKNAHSYKPVFIVTACYRNQRSGLALPLGFSVSSGVGEN
ncbi:pilus assembly protein [Vibrio mediterranei]|uniref:TadE family protein n=1 Tax=Vibrio mediterranei TaxID=689 RepID=UPI001EFEEC55|nr:TadE family protein [Vibrio mediterranei]MCG9629082.1 pilus assembly protein [Vibrio mediterranei]